MIKLGTLVFYVVLAWVAVTQPLTLGANISIGLLVLLVVVHLGECFLYRDLIQRAPGSSAWHLLNVFLFGVFHMIAMKESIRAAGGTA